MFILFYRLSVLFITAFMTCSSNQASKSCKFAYFGPIMGATAALVPPHMDGNGEGVYQEKGVSNQKAEPRPSQRQHTWNPGVLVTVEAYLYSREALWSPIVQQAGEFCVTSGYDVSCAHPTTTAITHPRSMLW